jgi:hypothetical protein
MLLAATAGCNSNNACDKPIPCDSNLDPSQDAPTDFPDMWSSLMSSTGGTSAYPAAGAGGSGGSPVTGGTGGSKSPTPTTEEDAGAVPPSQGGTGGMGTGGSG